MTFEDLQPDLMTTIATSTVANEIKSEIVIWRDEKEQTIDDWGSHLSLRISGEQGRQKFFTSAMSLIALER